MFTNFDFIYFIAFLLLLLLFVSIVLVCSCFMILIKSVNINCVNSIAIVINYFYFREFDTRMNTRLQLDHDAISLFLSD